MILTCPSCATGYFVPDDAVGRDGRKVRCQACAHVWRAEAPEEILDLTATPTPGAASGPAGAADPNADAAIARAFAAEAPDGLADTPAPELPKAFRARAEQVRRLRRAAAHGIVWAGLAGVFAAILAGAWLFRIEVVDIYPRAAAAYAAIGAPVNPVGLQFEAVGARPLVNDPGKVVVSGALRNVRDREIVAPAIRVALLDAHGAEIGHRILELHAAPVLPGKVQGFAVVMPDPGAKAAGVDVQFVGRSPAPHPEPEAKHGEDADAHGADTHGSEAKEADPHAPDPHAPGPHAPAPAAHPAPEAHGPAAPAPRSAAESGLRPALGADSHAGPVDARPISHDAPLDSGHGEPVSASHHG